MIKKGIVSLSFDDGKSVAAVPMGGEIVSAPLTVPFFLIGALPIGTEIIFTTFDDNTGIVLARSDGEWNHNFGEVT